MPHLALNCEGATRSLYPTTHPDDRHARAGGAANGRRAFSERDQIGGRQRVTEPCQLVGSVLQVQVPAVTTQLEFVSQRRFFSLRGGTTYHRTCAEAAEVVVSRPIQGEIRAWLRALS